MMDSTHPDVFFDFAEVRHDGSVSPKQVGDVKLRQWTKASPRMASQVRDSPLSAWRNSEVALRVRFPLPLLDDHPVLLVSIYRHWAPCVDRKAAQQRALVRITRSSSSSSSSNECSIEVHESITRSNKRASLSNEGGIITVVIPLVPQSFKLPESSTLPDDWKGQARNVSVYFEVRTPTAALRSLPPTKDDSFFVEQYPKRIGTAAGAAAPASAAARHARRAFSPAGNELIDLPHMLTIQAVQQHQHHQQHCGKHMRALKRSPTSSCSSSDSISEDEGYPMTKCARAARGVDSGVAAAGPAFTPFVDPFADMVAQATTMAASSSAHYPSYHASLLALKQEDGVRAPQFLHLQQMQARMQLQQQQQQQQQQMNNYEHINRLIYEVSPSLFMNLINPSI